ncbi:MAG: thiamine diphosphokinase [Chloroflexi bacterium]|nr:thiamine diphosphokinase [Chloroflexota bacterium]
MPAALVFAAAPLEPTARLAARLAGLDSPSVIAADDGATTALAFGLTPDLVIGDLDSVAASTLEQVRRRQVPVETLPRDKNATDGQLAIQRALESRPSELFLVGFLGGPRLDQALANVLLLTTIETPTVLLDARNECRLLRPRTPLTWTADPEEVISLIPLATTVDGVSTAGLRWPLRDEPLYFGDTRGVSNEPVEAQVTVQTRAGLLLVTRHFPL